MGGDSPRLIGGHLYTHLGIASGMLDDLTVETVLPADGGIRAASLGLAMEHGMPLLARVVAVPVAISVHLRGTGRESGHVRIATRVARLGRTMMFTESIFSGDLGRTVGFGMIAWSVSGPVQEGQVPPASLPPAGQQQIVPVPDALGLQPVLEGDGCSLSAISPDISGPGGVLHAGAIQILCEEAAHVAARRALAIGEVTTRDCVFHLLAAGRAGPFVARASFLASGTDGADLRVELRDEGRDGCLVALAEVRSASLPAG